MRSGHTRMLKSPTGSISQDCSIWNSQPEYYGSSSISSKKGAAMCLFKPPEMKSMSPLRPFFISEKFAAHRRFQNRTVYLSYGTRHLPPPSLLKLIFQRRLHGKRQGNLRYRALSMTIFFYNVMNHHNSNYEIS